MSQPPTDLELEAYLDEGLPAERMTRIEDALRGDAKLVDRVARIIGRRDAGVHSLGEIWRRGRITCPTREQLGAFLLGALEADHASYVKFHLETIGCRFCQANLHDLQAKAAAVPSTDEQRRRRKFFQTSAGLLKK